MLGNRPVQVKLEAPACGGGREAVGVERRRPRTAGSRRCPRHPPQRRRRPGPPKCRRWRAPVPARCEAAARASSSRPTSVAIAGLGRRREDRCRARGSPPPPRPPGAPPPPSCTDRPTTNPGGASPARARGRHRIAAQVHAVRAGGQRHVEPIVDDDAGRLPRVRAPPGARASAARSPALEVALAHVHQVHPRVDRDRDLLAPAPRAGPRRRRDTRASRRRSVTRQRIGAGRGDQGADMQRTAGGARSDTSSATAAATFTRPRPETAPRTK